MTISRVFPSGVSPNAEFTSAQGTQLDQNIVKALDKTVAGDTLAGMITVSSAAGFDFQSGSVAQFESGAGPVLKNGAIVSLQAGGTVSITTGISTATFDAAALVAWILRGAVALNGATTLAGATTVSGSLTMSGTSNVQLASRSITRVARIPKFSDATVWGIDSTGNVSNTSITTSSKAVYDIDVPHGATLTAVTLTILPATSHAGVPSAPPALSIRAITDANANTSLGSQTDTNTGSVGAYETMHTIAVSGLSTAINRASTHYVAIVTPESGTNALLGARLVSLSWTATITAYDEG